MDCGEEYGSLLSHYDSNGDGEGDSCASNMVNPIIALIHRCFCSFRTKAEATKAGNTAMADYLNIGLTDQETEISFADYLDLWIKNDCEVDLKETTVESYRKAVELYMKPYLGGYMLRSIRREYLQDYLMYMFNAGFSKHSMTKLKALLTKSFNYALDNNYIRHNPSVRLRMPKNRDPETPTRCKPHHYLPIKSRSFNKCRKYN